MIKKGGVRKKPVFCHTGGGQKVADMASTIKVFCMPSIIYDEQTLTFGTDVINART